MTLIFYPLPTSKFQNGLEELKVYLRNRSYPMALIEAGVQKTRAKEPEGMQPANQDDEKNILLFISTYNPKKPKTFLYNPIQLANSENDDKNKPILEKYFEN